MRLALIGLGKMGANMTRRLLSDDLEVVGYDRSRQVVEDLSVDGMLAADSMLHAVQQLQAPRIVWLMIPSGAPTDNALQELVPILEAGDIVIDGGNSNYHDSQRHGAMLATHDIGFVDAGTSGGVWGLKNGYCLMVGGEREVVAQIEPILKSLAPAADRGWAHVGPIGSGHFTKMIHNGIEYGMMQAFAEGFELLDAKQEMALDLQQISEIWQHGSVVRSWLLDLIVDAFEADESLSSMSDYVDDSGEGRWTVQDSIELGVPTPVLTLALQMRFRSRQSSSFSCKVLNSMRAGFGGHPIKPAE